MKARRLRIIAVVSIGAALVFIFLLWQRSTGPEPLARAHYSALADKDWGAIYDISLPEYSQYGISRADFVSCMHILSNGVPKSYFESMEWKDVPQQQIGNTPGRYHQIIEFKAVPRYDGRPTGTQVQFHRLRSGWYVDSTSLPYVLIRMHCLPRADQLGLLHRAFVQCGIDRWPQPHGQEVVVNRIPESIAEKNWDYVQPRRR